MSSFLTQLIYWDKIIGEDEIESCAYGIQITMDNLINFAIAFSIGLLTESLAEMNYFSGDMYLGKGTY